VSYLVAAYGVTVLTLAIYGGMLHRERRRLARGADDDAGR
jgi:hypothetical protein